jgi:hypothetical protein
VLKNLAQGATDGTDRLGLAKRVFQLTKDLRLAQNQGIKAAGDTKQVTNGLVVLLAKQRLMEGLIERPRVCQPLLQTVAARIVPDEIKFGTITRRQEYRFVDTLDFFHVAESR